MRDAEEEDKNPFHDDDAKFMQVGPKERESKQWKRNPVTDPSLWILLPPAPYQNDDDIVIALFLIRF